MKEPNPFGELLRTYREQYGFGIRKLSKVLGYDKQQITQWENGRIKPPKGSVIREISVALCLTEAEADQLASRAYQYYLGHLKGKYSTEWGHVIDQG